MLPKIYDLDAGEVAFFYAPRHLQYSVARTAPICV
jgi:hypothetical protein